MSQQIAIETSAISKSFGDVTAVANVNLRVNAGEVVGFIGPNGAGKTTTISILMGFLRPSHGKVSVAEQVITPETAHLSHQYIGYVSGDMALLDNLSGQQYIDHIGHINRADKQVQADLISQLKPILNKPIKNLSRGNKQKIALIGALQHKPKVLILDEPTSGLDPLMQEIFLSLIRQAANDGAAVFMSSHILSEVSQVCDRLLFMKQGKIISDTTRDDLEKQAGKEIVITVTRSQQEKIIDSAPTGLSLISRTTEKIKFTTSQPIQPFLKWLAELEIDDVTIRDRDLESIFHDMYKESEQ